MTGEEWQGRPGVSIDRPGTGMVLCAVAMAVFAVQDSFTRVLVADIAPQQIMAVRLWIFALGALAWAAWRGVLPAVLRPARPVLQVIRASFSAFEMVTIALALKYLGLAEAHSLFASFPLMAAVMARFVLGERLPALLVEAAAFIALGAAALFAAYQVAGRLAARHDDFLTSVVQISLIGALILTPFGLLSWKAPDASQWMMILAISGFGILGHLLLVRAVEFAPAAVLQPFNYLLLAFAFLIGMGWFGERPDALSVTGALIIAAAGLYSVLRR